MRKGVIMEFFNGCILWIRLVFLVCIIKNMVKFILVVFYKSNKIGRKGYCVILNGIIIVRFL